jgi:uncharacterized protein (DUF2147 family)
MNVVRLCLALTAFLLTTTPSLADDVLGTWLRDNGALQVKFEPCGDAICGNIVWLKPGSASKAKVGQRLWANSEISIRRPCRRILRWQKDERKRLKSRW